MSSFTRKGTVSKVSGPTHCNSYAMRGVPLRYKPPIFVPELLQLPPNWTKPTLPSIDSFNYDYSTEKRITEQAKTRALSVAAEASLQRKQILALQQQQQQPSGSDVNSKDAQPPTAMPRLPFMSTTDILTPTPVGPSSPKSSTPRNSTGNIASAANQSSSSGESGSSHSLTVEDEPQAGSNKAKSESNFKSLGHFSLKEFEGDVDPFEMASLQAINDMEELQSVLQPTAPPVVVSSSTPAVMAQSHISTVFNTSQSTNHSSPILNTNLATVTGNTNTSVTPGPSVFNNSSPELKGVLNTAPPVVAPVSSMSESGDIATHRKSSPLLVSSSSSSSTEALLSQPVPVVASTNPFMSGNPIATTTTAAAINVSSTNPFLSTEPAQNLYPVIPTVTQQQQQQQQQRSEPGVGTLVDLGGTSGANHIQPKPPVPAVRTSPKLLNKTSPYPPNVTTSSPASGTVPIPKPRKKSPSPSSTPPGGGRGEATVISSASVPNSHPSPSTHPVVPDVTRTTSNPTVVASRSVGSGNPQFPTPRNRSNIGGGASQFPTPSRNHFDIGVPVLPPIPTSNSVPITTANDLPPAYKLQATPPTAHRVSPPPPYSSPATNRHLSSRVPTVAPKTYRLPNPEASLTSQQKELVKTISGMGFPPQRVGRAILRFEDDQTKILDFLVLVGELEDVRFSGDSAETALVASDDNLDEAKAYLQKVGAFKDIGFQEKAIHEAYSKAKGDWDEALDILTRER